MNYNEYGEVINGSNTYKLLSKLLYLTHSVGIGWTDNKSTHLDVILKLELNNKYGIFQRGIKQDYLFVGIIDHTCYGFSIENIKHQSYIQEKLRMNNECGEKLAELINNIIIELHKIEDLK